MLCDDKPHCQSKEDESRGMCEQHNRVSCVRRCHGNKNLLNLSLNVSFLLQCPLRCDGRCLAEKRICDQQVDCSDKSDEMPDACRSVGRPQVQSNFESSESASDRRVRPFSPNHVFCLFVCLTFVLGECIVE